MPSPNPTVRRQHAGAAAPSTLQSSITGADVAIVLTGNAGWPNGAVGPFFIVIDPGLATEEKILIATRAGNNLAVAGSGRGADGTIAAAHTGGAVCYPVWTALEADEANEHTASISAVHGVAGSVVGTTDVQTLTNKTISGTVNTITNVPAANLTGTIPISAGGTGQITAALARTALGLAIGTDVQAQDAQLAAIAGLTPGSGQYVYFTGLTTAALDNITAAGRALIDDADANTMRGTLNAQQASTKLAGIAGMSAAVGVVTHTGSDVYLHRILTSTGGTIAITNANFVSNNPNLEVHDTGIITAGFAAASGWDFSQAQYRIVGKTCSVIIFAERTGSSLSAATILSTNPDLGTLPAAACPQADWAEAWTNPTDCAGWWNIDPSGPMFLMESTGTIDNGDTVLFTGTWLVA